MRLRQLVLTGAVVGLGYFIYSSGLWEPLRTTLVAALGGIVTIGAVLANAKARQLRPRSLEFLDIATASVGVVALQFAIGSAVPGTGATLLLTALGGAAIGAGVVLGLKAGPNSTTTPLTPSTGTDPLARDEVDRLLAPPTHGPTGLLVRDTDAAEERG